MKRIKENKTLKYSLFFGFYLIFFIFLGVYLNRMNDKINSPTQEEKNGEYSLTALMDNSYQVEIREEEKSVVYNVSDLEAKSESYAYFGNIYNLNQLIKKSRFVEEKDHILYFLLNNKELNALLNTEMEEKDNEIKLLVNDERIVKEISLSLDNYYGTAISIILKNSEEKS